jgi:hypothetical protein
MIYIFGKGDGIHGPCRDTIAGICSSNLLVTAPGQIGLFCVDAQ